MRQLVRETSFVEMFPDDNVAVDVALEDAEVVDGHVGDDYVDTQSEMTCSKLSIENKN